MSMRIVPPASYSKSTDLQAQGAPSAPGVHDTLRHNLHGDLPSGSPSESNKFPVSSHPLEARLSQWRATQENLKMQGLRKQFGMGEPIRRGMELKLAQAGEWRPAALGGSASVSSDVLSGRDESIDWEDVYARNDTRETADMHTEMEAKLKMNW